MTELALSREMMAGIAALLGLCLGSFLNVCVFRWPQDQSVISPPSRCPGCDTPIAWRDNIPVLGWVLLRGRCRHCGMSISFQYPLIELVTGLIWGALFYQQGLSVEALRGALFLTILLGISLTDARFYIIPDEFSIGGAVLGLALAPLAGGLTVASALGGAAIGYFGFLALGLGMTWALRKFAPHRLEAAGVDQALGGGDVKMMALVGAFLGPMGVPMTVFLGTVLGLVIFVPISLRTNRLIPFGIFLAVGAAATYLWGESILAWYMTDIMGVPYP